MIDSPRTPDRVQQVRLNATPDEELLWQTLEDVQDPEFPMSVVDMGLIYGLQRLGHRVQVQLTFTAMGCPCMEFIIGDIRDRLLEEAGVDEVEIQIVWDPPWTRQRLSARGVDKLKRWGVSV